ncbi:DUF2993 domain-containing protein, partial [Leptolyngbya sp. FACHB-36]|uniref:LmeA family phospholipid-binding protein n=1 Tax=Leptolyngbya sp. FACHB-36 TaxID=2692808 RepID=UPI001680D944
TIQRVVVSAHNAVYRGLHLSQISLTAEGIHTNLGQVVRGKPLRLLTVFPVSGSVQISEADLNRSLKAPLLGNALVDVLLTLLKSDLQDESGVEDLRLQDPQVNLRDGQLTLIATLVSASGSLTPVVIRTGLHLEAGRMLKLDRPQWLPHANARQGLPLKDLDGFAFDLGSEVCLETLTIAPEQIFCQGQIQVTPEES